MNPQPNPTPTPLSSTAMEAARDLFPAWTRDEQTDPLALDHLSYFATIIQKHFQPLLAKVEGERDAWIECARQFSHSATFYHDIVTKIGELFGVAAKTSDDGSIQQDVLALKVPELVSALRADLAAANGEIAGLKVKVKDWKESAEILESQRDQLRADLAAKEAALAHYAHADFLTTEQQRIADNALKPHAK